MEEADFYLKMMEDTKNAIVSEKTKNLSTAIIAASKSCDLANETQFWNWMGQNYPNNFGTASLARETAMQKSFWMNNAIQGKGYEWDFMTVKRADLSNILSRFDAGDCPTQPGIDITQSNMLTGDIEATYQNKAYLSTNNPDIHNTTKDAVVVTNREKVEFIKERGFKTEEYMDAEEIKRIRDDRIETALKGEASGTTSILSVAKTSIKAGAISAVVGMGIEAVSSYKAMKNGQISQQEYVREILKTGGQTGLVGAGTTAVMYGVNIQLAALGASSIIGIPVAFIVGSTLNSIIAPCFGRGKYQKYLNEAKYYKSIELAHKDLVYQITISANEYINYARLVKEQASRFQANKNYSDKMNNTLNSLYKSI